MSDRMPRIGILGIMQDLYDEMIPGIAERQAGYAAELAARLAGVAECVPGRPVKGQMLSLRMNPADPLIRHVVWGPRAYLVPRSDGRLIVGGTVEEFTRKREVLHQHCADIGRDPAQILLSSHVRFDGDPAATAAAAAALAAAGAGLAIVQLRPPHTPDVLGPLAEALAELD